MKKPILFRTCKYLLILLASMIFLMNNYFYGQNFGFTNLNYSNYPNISAQFIALDSNGKHIENLNPSDFVVTENGVSVNSSLNVGCIDTTSYPALSIAIVLDQSVSMSWSVPSGGRRWDYVCSAVSKFVQSLDFSHGTMVCIITFQKYALLKMPFTNQVNEVIDSLDMIWLAGGTEYDPPFLDKLTGAVAQLKTRPIDIPRYIIFVTDGESNHTPSTDSIISECRSNNIQVNSYTLFLPMNDYLRKISDSTGGVALGMPDETVIDNIFALSALDLQKEQVCTLNWQATNACTEESRNRKVEAIFLPLAKYSIVSYKAPGKSVVFPILSDSAIQFGNITSNTQECFDFTVTAKNSPLTITGASTQPSAYFKIINWGGSPPPFVLDTGQSRVISVCFTQSSSKSYREGTLLFNAAPCDITIPLYGGPAKLSLTKPADGVYYSICDTIEIAWDNVEPAAVVNLFYSSDGGTSWRPIVLNATGLYYKWLPPSVGDFIIKIIDAGNSVNFDENSKAFTISRPEISVTQTKLDFGITNIGKSHLFQVDKVLCNKGKVPAKISGVTFIGKNKNDFKCMINLSGMAIKPGECIDLEFEFVPSTLGYHSATMTIIGECNTLTFFELTGMGRCSGERVPRVDFGIFKQNMKKDTLINCIIKNTNNEILIINPVIQGAS
nr:Choice-of-anchor protein [Bacteroidota bacterium]